MHQGALEPMEMRGRVPSDTPLARTMDGTPWGSGEKSVADGIAARGVLQARSLEIGR